jgi:hypothetical protein
MNIFQAFIRTATDAATAGVTQMALSGPSQPQARRKQKRKKTACTTCDALDLADKVRAEVKKNRLFGDRP